MRRSARWASIVAASIIAGSPLVAQEGMESYANPVSFGILAGASIPVGDFSEDFAGTGFHVGALLQWKSPTAPIGIRADGVYHKFGNSGTGTFDPSMFVGTIDGVLLLSPTSIVRPFLIAGGGIYNERCNICDSQTKFGINGGVGITVPLSGIATLVEARLHMVFDKVDAAAGAPEIGNTTFIPISVSILFR